MQYRDDLLRAFGIGSEDLEANRGGALTAKQSAKLVQGGIRDLLAAVVIGLLLAAVLYFVADKPLKPVQYGLAALLTLAALLVGFNTFRKSRAAAAAGRVECVVGPIRVQQRGQNGWFLLVEGRSFRLPVHVWRTRDGVVHRVYFAPGIDRIVAMEPQGPSTNEPGAT